MRCLKPDALIEGTCLFLKYFWTGTERTETKELSIGEEFSALLEIIRSTAYENKNWNYRLRHDF
jgi:hypothetical protein